MTDSFDMTKARPENFEGFIRARKKPVEIDALQVNLSEGFVVHTKEGSMRGKCGDYLIIGVEGEPYPCDKDIFEKTYTVD
jgi:hypothetical protein